MDLASLAFCPTNFFQKAPPVKSPSVPVSIQGLQYGRSRFPTPAAVLYNVSVVGTGPSFDGLVLPCPAQPGLSPAGRQSTVTLAVHRLTTAHLEGLIEVETEICQHHPEFLPAVRVFELPEQVAAELAVDGRRRVRHADGDAAVPADVRAAVTAPVGLTLGGGHQRLARVVRGQAGHYLVGGACRVERVRSGPRVIGRELDEKKSHGRMRTESGTDRQVTNLVR